MSKIEIENHGNFFKNKFKFKNDEEYYNNFKENNFGAKVHFIDGTTIKGLIIKSDKFNIYLNHKNNILLIHKGSIKIIEPLPLENKKESQE